MNAKQKYRTTKQWKMFRKLVIQRSNGYCELCGQKTKKLQIHHINEQAYEHEELQDVAALCYLCHKLVERLIIRKKFRETEYTEFLNMILKKFHKENNIISEVKI